jgi:hypothetical protein
MSAFMPLLLLAKGEGPAISCGPNCLHFDSGPHTGFWEGGVDSQGAANGKGAFLLRNGGIYEGTMESNEFHGKGKLRTLDSGSYEGDWVKNERHGVGILTKRDVIYKGRWQHGQQHGEGMLIEGRLITKGVWQEGTLMTSTAQRCLRDKCFRYDAPTLGHLAADLSLLDRNMHEERLAHLWHQVCSSACSTLYLLIFPLHATYTIHTFERGFARVALLILVLTTVHGPN